MDICHGAPTEDVDWLTLLRISMFGVTIGPSTLDFVTGRFSQWLKGVSRPSPWFGKAEYAQSLGIAGFN